MVNDSLSKQLIEQKACILGEKERDADGTIHWKLTVLEPPPVSANASHSEGQNSYPDRIKMIVAILQEADIREFPDNYPLVLRAYHWSDSLIMTLRVAREHLKKNKNNT